MMRLLREIKIELYTSVLLQYHLPVLLFHRWYMRWFLSVRLNSNHCHLSGKCLLHRVICSSYTSNRCIYWYFWRKNSMRHCWTIKRKISLCGRRYITKSKLEAFVLRVNGSKGDTTRSTEDDEGCRALSKYPFFFFASILRWPRRTALSSAQRHLVFFGRACTYTRANHTGRSREHACKDGTIYSRSSRYTTLYR